MLTIKTDFDDYDLIKINDIFEYQLERSYDIYPNYMRYSFARDIIPYHKGQEDEEYSVLWVYYNKTCVIDQLSEYHIITILNRMNRVYNKIKRKKI